MTYPIQQSPDMDSFSVRRLFRWMPRDGQRKKHLFEEPFPLWQAGSAEEAMEAAKREARGHSSESSEYLEACQACGLLNE